MLCLRRTVSEDYSLLQFLLSWILLLLSRGVNMILFLRFYFASSFTIFSPCHNLLILLAIKFAARKTANLSGDIRKAFQICKVAAESVFEDFNSGRRESSSSSSAQPIVRIADIQRASRDMFHSMIHKAISCCTSYEALLMIAIGSLKRATGREDGAFEVVEILTKIESIASASGENRYADANLSFSDVLEMLNRLGDAKIITLDTPRNSNSPWPLVSTSLHAYEIYASFRNTNNYNLAEKNLAEKRFF